MGLHSSLLENGMCLTEWGLDLTSITTMSWGGMKMWVHTPLSLCAGQSYCVVWLCDGRETTVGCLGNKGLPQASVSPALLPPLSLHLCLLLSFLLSWSVFCLTSWSSLVMSVRLLLWYALCYSFSLWNGKKKCVSSWCLSIPCWVLTGGKSKL